jgi:hypothetical protein
MAQNSATLKDVKLVFRNFAGEARQYNNEGDRNFAILLDPETAAEMEKDGWNIKRKPPREEGEPEFIFLTVKVNFNGNTPPQLILITKSKGRRTTLEAKDAGILDWATLEMVDVMIRPYHWKVNGNSGVTAYLQKVYATLHEDELDLKYAQYEEGATLPDPRHEDEPDGYRDHIDSGI